MHEAASKRDREGYNYAASNVSLTDTDSGYAGSTYGDEETIYTLALSDASVGSTDTLVGTGPVPVWDGEELSWVYDDGVISPCVFSLFLFLNLSPFALPLPFTDFLRIQCCERIRQPQRPERPSRPTSSCQK